MSFFIDNYLKKEGKVIISLPNIANWQVRFGLFFGKFNYKETGILDKSHLHFYTFESARELIKVCNLRILKELCGASFFGLVTKYFPFLKPLLSTNIILMCEK